ncbi:crumbs 3, cell polarity complex component [Chelydra serpentina]|uniref:Crumbs 3, cell polarity complex component n=1 Tax=Chelydra serpentina TaxID=8475 RepID=A0A8T1SI84_CHESE|nr:crumbs 3, cell polarity complex component [Chelydra serpentina]
MSPPPSQTPTGVMAGSSHPLLLAVALQSLLQPALGQATNGSTATPASELRGTKGAKMSRVLGLTFLRITL